MARCEQLPAFRFTWPGRDEDYACVDHAAKLIKISRAMGYHLQVVPLSGDEQLKVACSQELED